LDNESSSISIYCHIIDIKKQQTATLHTPSINTHSQGNKIDHGTGPADNTLCIKHKQTKKTTMDTSSISPKRNLWLHHRRASHSHCKCKHTKSNANSYIRCSQCNVPNPHHSAHCFHAEFLSQKYNLLIPSSANRSPQTLPA